MHCLVLSCLVLFLFPNGFYNVKVKRQKNNMVYMSRELNSTNEVKSELTVSQQKDQHHQYHKLLDMVVKGQDCCYWFYWQYCFFERRKQSNILKYEKYIWIINSFVWIELTVVAITLGTLPNTTIHWSLLTTDYWIHIWDSIVVVIWDYIAISSTLMKLKSVLACFDKFSNVNTRNTNTPRFRFILTVTHSIGSKLEGLLLFLWSPHSFSLVENNDSII